MRLSVLPVKFALEIFACTARVTQALHEHGLSAFPIDICISPLHDLSDLTVEHFICHLLESGRVNFVWLGMPCTSFSRARKWDGVGPGPWRDMDNLLGFSWLSPTDAKKVRTGNNLLRVSLRFLEICQQLRTPYALENPRTSYAWSMPSMKRFIASHQPSLCFLDFCQYGEEWRKPTTIMGNFWPVHQISRTCEPHHGLCSQTNRPHFALAGTDEHNVFWTLRAQPYPRALCDAVASVVAKSLA